MGEPGRRAGLRSPLSFPALAAGKNAPGMRATADRLLALPVRHNGIELGRPVDLSIDLVGGRVIGIEVRCRDESLRFLPLGAARLGADEIAVGSALLLLDDIGFYRLRGTGFRSLRGEPVEYSGRRLGVLRDVAIGEEGGIEALVVEDGRGLRPVRFHPSIRVARRRLPAA